MLFKYVGFFFIIIYINLYRLKKENFIYNSKNWEVV